MSNPIYDIDPELLNGFIDDSLDDLESLDALFIKLEASPDDLNIIQAIFRPVHSIKGNSAFFGLLKLKKLAHELETLLDLIRKEQLNASASVVSVLLEGMDELKAILTRTRDKENEIADMPAFEALVQKVVQAQKGSEDKPWHEKKILQRLENLVNVCTELEENHIQELQDLINYVNALVIEESGADDNAVASTPGQNYPPELDTIAAIAQQAQTASVSEENAQSVLENLQHLQQVVDDQQARELIDSAIDEYHTMMDALGFDPLLGELLTVKIKQLKALSCWAATSDESPSEPSSKAEPDSAPPASPEDPSEKKEKPAAKTNPATDAVKTMRVSEESVDNFLSYVGELIVVGEMYNHLQRHVAAVETTQNLATDFKRVNQSFYTLSTSLQKSIMDIRKVPIRAILQKVPRMVRDITLNNKKNINVVIEGEDIRIDKSLIEVLDAPLTHMVRNAADHGIELPEDRKQAGKAETGEIVVQAKESASHMHLTIQDNGRGLNLPAIRQKAMTLGIVNENQELKHDQLVDLLFSSGVSTAKEVTDISGRGVGMDVVKRNIDQANGQIKITTEPGHGTTFEITLPKNTTTQIIDGYLVQLDNNCYVIPLEKVKEVFRTDVDTLKSVKNQGQCVLRHGELIPIVRLFQSFHAKPTSDVQTLVTIDHGRQRIALAIDNIVGIQRVVLKELKGLAISGDIYSAAAVMGDGSVAMVLNVDAIQANAQ